MARKKWFLAGAFLVGILGFLVNAPSSHATLVEAGNIINFDDGPGSLGGEFIANVYDGPSTSTSSTSLGSFTTFCLERNEFINFHSDYTVDSITGAAVAGGESGGSPDPLSYESIYLFWNLFYSPNSFYGTGGNVYYSSNETQANLFQNAIWFLEGETNNADPTSNDYLIAANTAIAGGWINDFYLNPTANVNQEYVAVMNIVGAYGNAQSQGCESNVPTIPEPGTMFLVGSSLFLLAGFGTRRFQEEITGIGDS